MPQSVNSNSTGASSHFGNNGFAPAGAAGPPVAAAPVVVAPPAPVAAAPALIKQQSKENNLVESPNSSEGGHKTKAMLKGWSTLGNSRKDFSVLIY
jgi:hypothetical protein